MSHPEPAYPAAISATHHEPDLTYAGGNTVHHLAWNNRHVLAVACRSGQGPIV
jgi:hypothetical protein